MCDPAVNPNAAAFFIFNYCLTQDEDRGGLIGPLPDPTGRGRFALAYVEELDAARLDPVFNPGRIPHNIHDEKPRRILHTWLNCHYNLWSLMWVRGYSSLLISRSEDHVDDGGKHERTFSMFSRMRFAYDRLPTHVKKGVSWQHMAGTCPENDAYTIGRAPTKDAGRGAGTVRAFVEECEHIEWMEAIHVALDPACKLGKVYSGTVNGNRTLVAQIKRERRAGWKFLEYNWWDDEAHAQGIRDTEPGSAEYSRYGQRVSEWFIAATASLRDEDIAQEYLRDRTRSTKGLVYKEFNLRKHVPDVRVPFDSSLPIRVGVDYGSTGFGAAVVGQMVGPWSLNCVTDYELEGAGGAKEHAINLAQVLRAIGYDGELSDVQLVGGPDTNTTQTGSGQTIGGYYRAAGFTRIRESRVRGPGSVDRGITVVCQSLREDRILISSACKNLIGRFGEYRWPVERATGVVRDTAPVHNESSHIMDAFRYLVTDCFPTETKGIPFRSGELGPPLQKPMESRTDLPPAYTPDTWKRTIVGAMQEY